MQSSSILLPAYLHTLAVLLVAAGASSHNSGQLVAEFWDLLLSLRTAAVGDISVLEGTLFGFLTILNLFENKRRLAENFAKQLTETHEWAETVFDKGLGTTSEGERVHTLAAAVLVATKEVVSTYHRLLLGDLVEH